MLDFHSLMKTYTATPTDIDHQWCVVDAAGMPLVGGRTLAGGDSEGPFRSKSFRVTLGNGGGDLRVNGKLRDVPDSSVPVGLAIGPNGTRPLAESRRPTCSGAG